MDARLYEDVLLTVEYEEEEEEAEPTPEEKAAEAEATSEVDEDELRDKIAEQYGINPDEQSDLLDKLVSNEQEHRKKLSSAIKQKITWRDRASSQKPPVKKEDGKSHKKEDVDIDAIVDQKLNERLEARDLKELKLPEELEAEVKKIAKVNGVSVREAAQDPYFVFKKTDYEKKELIKKATPKRSNNGTYATNIDPSKPLNPADFDLSTEEGRKSWNDAKAARRQHLNK